MKYPALIAGLVLLSYRLALGANVTEFDSLWKDLSQKSYGIAAEQSTTDAFSVAASRASMHWAPRLFLQGQALSTNDPGNSLFSNLGTRSLQMTDLSPTVMNEPAREWFKRGSVTLDWTLFEGGSRVLMGRGARLRAQSQDLSLEFRRREEYAQLARDYGRLISLRAEEKSYRDLKDKLTAILSRYRVGSRDNPVGYSGLLGMRSLLNRLEGQLAQAQTEIFGLENSILVRTQRSDPSIKTPQDVEVETFVEERLLIRDSQSKRSNLHAESLRVSADAQGEFAKAEKARWLPKVGLFATGNLTSGARDTGTSTEYGAYLQWEIFNAENLGATQEATLKSAAASRRAEEMSQISRIQSDTLARSLPMLRDNVKRARESLSLTSEQVIVTEKLFRNGSINALQFVEVLSRRTDVVQSKRLVEYAYLDGSMAEYLENSDPEKASTP